IARRSRAIIARFASHLEIHLLAGKDLLESEVARQVGEMEVVLLAVFRADEAEATAVLLFVDRPGHALARLVDLRRRPNRRRGIDILLLRLLLLLIEDLAAGVAEKRLAPAGAEAGPHFAVAGVHRGLAFELAALKFQLHLRKQIVEPDRVKILHARFVAW